MTSFGTGWKSMWRSVATASQRSALHMLSDHMLKDTGLSRADIDGIASNSAEGRTDATRRRRGH